MYLINTTFFIESSIGKEFINSLKEIVIPGIVKTGMFQGTELFEIMTQNSDNVDEISLALQLRAENDKALIWVQENFPALTSALMARYPDKSLHFTTVMKSVEI